MEILRRFFIVTLLVGFFVVEAPAVHAGITRPMDNRGLVGYWSMEDCRGTKATDSSGRGNTGILAGTFALTGTTSNWVAGKRGSCALNFDGSNDYVIADVISNDIATGDVTISAWVRFTSANWAAGGSIGEVFENRDIPSTNDIYFEFGTAGRLSLSAFNGSTFYTAQTSKVFWQRNQWYHIVGTIVSGGALNIYVDGVADGSGSMTGSRGGIASVLARLGSDANNASIFPGSIDDVRIYNRALTAAEVASLYNSGASKVTGSTTRGLVGYWSMEDCRGEKLTDSSGRGNSGTLTNFALTGTTSNWVAGKRGSCALNFDGSDDYVQISGLLGAPADITLSAWARKTTDASEDEVVSLGNYVVLRLRSADVQGAYHLGGSIWEAVISSTFNTSVWHHYVYTFDDAANAQRVYVDGVLAGSGNNATSIAWTSQGTDTFIGTHGGGSTLWRMYGAIDEVRVYNRALSAPEVAALYTAGATKIGVSTATLGANTNLTSGLVGHWTFDGPYLTSTTALDSSGSGFTGTLTGANGLPKPATGRLGQGLKFDGTDDFLSIADNAALKPTVETVSAWVNPSILTGSQLIANTGVRNSTWASYQLKFGVGDGGGTDGKISFTVRSANAAGNSTVTQLDTPSANTWTHVVGVNDGVTLSLYINGVLNNTGVGLSAYNPAGPIRIGGDADLAGANYRHIFRGSLDDVRVYNRALSASEVTQLYNLGR